MARSAILPALDRSEADAAFAELRLRQVRHSAGLTVEERFARVEALREFVLAMKPDSARGPSPGDESVELWLTILARLPR